MYFDSFKKEFIDFCHNVTDKFFCKKRERQEVDFNFHYLSKKHTQTPHYFKKNYNEYENYLLTNSTNRRTFQTVNLIKDKRQRQHSSKNYSSSNNLSILNIREDKNDFNEQILNPDLNIIKQSNSEEEKSNIIKTNYKFKTKIIKYEESNDSISDKSNSSRKYLSFPNIIEEKVNFEDFDHLTRYISRKKDANNYPLIEYNRYELFQE